MTPNSLGSENVALYEFFSIDDQDQTYQHDYARGCTELLLASGLSEPRQEEHIGWKMRAWGVDGVHEVGGLHGEVTQNVGMGWIQ